MGIDNSYPHVKSARPEIACYLRLTTIPCRLVSVVNNSPGKYYLRSLTPFHRTLFGISRDVMGRIPPHALRAPVIFLFTVFMSLLRSTNSASEKDARATLSASKPEAIIICKTQMFLRDDLLDDRVTVVTRAALF